ncbi:MAG: hypothetical protein ACLP01_25970 [Solirubrobacteraceae bacterium]
MIFCDRCAALGIEISRWSVIDRLATRPLRGVSLDVEARARALPSAGAPRELRTSVFGYIEGFSNTRRRHSTRGHLSRARDFWWCW